MMGAIAEHGKERAIPMLKKFGVSKVSELPETVYEEFLEALSKLGA